MDNVPILYPVQFKTDSGEVVYDALVSYTPLPLDTDENNPDLRDTIGIFDAAIGRVRKAIQEKGIREDALEISDIVDITFPDGKIVSLTQQNVYEMLDIIEAPEKYSLKEDSRLRVYKGGGFFGGIMSMYDVSMTGVSKTDFNRAARIVDILQTHAEKPTLEYAEWLGDFGYYVDVGDKDTPPPQLKLIFMGGAFSRTPIIVEELAGILEKYVPEDRALIL